MGTNKIFDVTTGSRQVLLKGINVVADVVKTTLGAKGKSVIINRKITKDGISVAKSIRLGDTDDSIGGNIIIEVSEKTVKLAGDGTTSAMVLAQAIVTEGFKLLAAGHNGQQLKSGIDKAVSAVVEKLKSMAVKIDIDSPKLKQIASISGNNNEEVGSLVSEAFIKTGKDGVIRLEQSNTGESYLKVVDGMQINRGYQSQIFITNKEKMTCEMESCYILLSEGKITTLKEIQGILEQVSKQPAQKGIIMIAEDFDGEALYTINVNRLKNNFPICLIKSPGFGDNKKQIMEDIAAVTGANISNDESGLRIDTLKLSDLGTAEKVIVGKEDTTIVGGGGNKIDIDEQIKSIRKLIDLCPPDDQFGKDKLEERLAKLTGGVAVIYVGAATEVELKEKYDRFEDAKLATGCSLAEGIVVGGGIALIRCQDVLDSLKGEDDNEQAGINLIRKVLEAPFRQMVSNSEKEIMVKELMGKGQNYGYNFKTDKFEDLVEVGVIDPAKVVRVTLETAASVAGTLLTTDALILNVDDELPPMLRK